MHAGAPENDITFDLSFVIALDLDNPHTDPCHMTCNAYDRVARVIRRDWKAFEYAKARPSFTLPQ